MPELIYQEALDAFANPFHEFTVKPLKAGLINESFKVTSKMTGGSFLLQKINQHVFLKPEKVQHNYETLWKFLKSEEINFFIPEPKYFPDDTTLFCDSKNNFWRVFEFVESTLTQNIAEKPTDAKAVAITFAEFTSCFSDFDIEQLYITIPGFHDLSSRFKQFKESLHKNDFSRLSKSSSIINELKKREAYANFYDIMTESDEFPQRVMHHDAKISNILFDEENGQPVCPVDLDTVMPGYFFSDIGDMIRSIACSHDENSIEFDSISIRKDFYQAILDGYQSVMNDFFTDSEKKYIHYAGVLIIYMQALRFMTDYLNGDIYYKIEYAEQNFDRAKNQFILLEKLEEFLKAEYHFKI